MKRKLVPVLGIVMAGLISTSAAALTPMGDVETYATPPKPGMNHWQQVRIDEGDISWAYYEAYIKANQDLPADFDVLDVIEITTIAPNNKDVSYDAEPLDDLVIPTWRAGEVMYLPVTPGGIESAAGSELQASYVDELDSLRSDFSAVVFDMQQRINDLATALANVDAETITINDVLGLDTTLAGIRRDMPNLGPLNGSVDELTRFMQALKVGDTTEIEALQQNLQVAVEGAFAERMSSFEARLSTFLTRINAEAQTRAEADTALAGRIEAATESLRTLTADGGRLAIVEGKLVAVDAQGREIDDLNRSIDVLADWAESNQSMSEANAADIAELKALYAALSSALANEQVVRQNADAGLELGLQVVAEQTEANAESQKKQDAQLTTLWVSGGAAVLIVLGLALVGSHFLDRKSKQPTEARVKRLEDIEAADLEWHPDNADLTTLQPGVENVVVWRVRQQGTEDWCAIRIGREADTPAGQVFTDMPAKVGGEPSDTLYSIDELPKLDILLAMKEGRIVPSRTGFDVDSMLNAASKNASENAADQISVAEKA